MQTDAQRKTILVIEDDLAIRDVLSEVLSDEGYIVIPAPDGERALDLLASVTPDLISLDFNLPGVRGIELIDAISERVSLEGCPIVLMTAAHRLPREVRERVESVVKKPFNIADLLVMIESLLT